MNERVDIRLRRIPAEEAAAYRSLRLRALLEHPTSFASSYEEEAPLTLEHVKGMLDSGVVLGAYDGAALAGMIGVRRERYKKLSHKGHIWGMYVAPEYRRAGVAARLVDAALEAARAMPGLEQLCISVYAGNDAARRLYVRAGFVTYGLEPRAVKVEGHTYDEEHLVRFLR